MSSDGTPAIGAASDRPLQNEGRDVSRELFDRIQNLEHTIATLTAQRDGATSAVNHMSLVQLKLQQDLIAAEKVCEAAQKLVDTNEDTYDWLVAKMELRDALKRRTEEGSTTPGSPPESQPSTD